VRSYLIFGAIWLFLQAVVLGFKVVRAAGLAETDYHIAMLHMGGMVAISGIFVSFCILWGLRNEHKRNQLHQ
jgi:hypothetical protein